MRLTIRYAIAMACSFVLAASVSVPRPLQAANAADASPSLTVMLAGSNELFADLTYLLKLTDTNEQKQLPVLKDYLSVFLIGVDDKLPTAITVLFGEKADRQVWSVPVQPNSLKKFRKDNIEAILTSRVKETTPGEFKLGTGRKDDFNGYMLYEAPYARIGEKLQDLKAVPANPQAVIKALLERNYVVAGEVRNAKTDAAAQKQRRELFQGTRKRALAAMTKVKGETAAEFDLRKKAVDVQMNEAELFFAESASAQIGLLVDRAKSLGKVDIELTPIAGSSLSQAVGLLGSRASYFANIEKSAEPILAARLNHPLTEMRQKDALAMTALTRDGVKAEADANEKLSADQKAATGQLADKTYDLFEAAIKAGQADGFVDVHKGTSGKNAFLGGVRTPGGGKIEEILNLVPKALPGSSVKLNVGEASGAKIHSIEFAKDQHPHWSEFIGADTVYVAASKDAVWAAAGEGALDTLKAALKKVTQPAPAGADKAPWAELAVRLKPWVERIAEAPKKRGSGDYRKLALSAFEPGADLLTVKMTQQSGKIVGEIVAQEGLLRFAGKAAAYFSKENLDSAPQKGAGK